MNNYSEFTPIIKEVSERITGRICDKQNNVAIMANYALLAGDGDHLEIGTLFGGSAIVVALLKKRNGLRGDVYCVDPLDGCYYQRKGKRIDEISGLKVNRKILERNISLFDLEERIKIIEKYSMPWPDELKNKMFVSAYIDGDHWDDMPLHDWNNIKEYVSRYVVFDNYDRLHPAVMTVCDRIASKDPSWKIAFRPFSRNGISYVLERVSNGNN